MREKSIMIGFTMTFSFLEKILRRKLIYFLMFRKLVKNASQEGFDVGTGLYGKKKMDVTELTGLL